MPSSSFLLWVAASCLLSLAPAFPSVSFESTNKRYTRRDDGIDYTVFEHAATQTNLTYVTDSGVCETTPGVHQYSGTLSVGNNKTMFFWLFEARDSPSTKPLALWLNGGPGCSSMVGLLEENGPCRFAPNSTTPEHNPYSWNNYGNMLYVDQPVGVGFSFGTEEVNSTINAAPDMWKFMQVFYDSFPEYKSQEFGLFSESYGGHYGPVFASHFQEQNAAVASGAIQGEQVNLVALGINNGWYDAKIQYRSYMEYAFKNSYRPLINEKFYKQLVADYDAGCGSLLDSCANDTGNDGACHNADHTCMQTFQTQIEQSGTWSPYDIRQQDSGEAPGGNWLDYLNNPDIQRKIGANFTFVTCSDSVNNKFTPTGDEGRSTLGFLSSVIQSNITVLIWNGDSDFNCNWMGNLDSLHAVKYPRQQEFKDAPMMPYTINGTSRGEFKNVGNLSWLKVFEAGHEVPMFQPEVSLKAFIQTMQKKPISAT